MDQKLPLLEIEGEKLPRRLLANALVIRGSQNALLPKTRVFGKSGFWNPLITKAAVELPKRFGKNALVIFWLLAFWEPPITISGRAVVHKREITKAFVHKRLGNQGGPRCTFAFWTPLITKTFVHKRFGNFAFVNYGAGRNGNWGFPKS